MNAIEEIKSAIQSYYGDTSRSRQETRDGLEEIATDVEMLIETLRGDTEDIPPTHAPRARYRQRRNTGEIDMTKTTMPEAGYISTDAFAKLVGVKPNTLRSALCREGHYFGIRPGRMPNRLLAWPAEEAEKFLAGALIPK